MAAQTKRVGRKHILRQAEKLFTEHGYQGVSMRMLAEASGVTNAALYYHFENKAALFREVMREHTKRVSADIREAAEEEESYRAKVKAMTQAYIRHASDQRSFLVLLRQRGKSNEFPKKKGAFIDMLLSIFKPFDEVIQQASAAGAVVDFPTESSPAAILVGMFHGLAGYRRICHDSKVIDEDIDFLVDLLWYGIANPEISPTDES